MQTPAGLRPGADSAACLLCCPDAKWGPREGQGSKHGWQGLHPHQPAHSSCSTVYTAEGEIDAKPLSPDTHAFFLPIGMSPSQPVEPPENKV